MNSYYWTILMGFLVNLIYIYGIEGRPASNLGGCESTYCAGLRDICKNGGKCVEDPTNRCQGKCKCSVRYSGPYCEVDKSSLPIILAPERHRQPRRYGNIMSFFASLSRKSSKTTKGTTTTTTTTTTKAPVTSTSTSTTESQSRLEIDDIKGGNANETSQDSKNSDDSNSESEINDNKNDKQDSSVMSIIPNDKEDDMDGNKRNNTSESDKNKSEKKENVEPRLSLQITEEDNDGNKTDTSSAEKKQDTKENKPSYLKRKITSKIKSDTNNTNTIDNSNEESQSLEILQNNTSSEEDKGEVDVVSTDLELTLESFRNLLQVDSLFSDGFGLPELQDSSDHVGSNDRGLLGDLAPVVSKRPVNDVGDGAAFRKTPLTKTSNDNAPSDVISQRMSSLSSVHGSAQDHVFSELSQLIDVPNSKPISTFKPIVLTTVSPLEMFLSNVMIKGAKKNSTIAAKELVFPDLETIINSNKLPPNKPNVTKNVKNETTQEKNKTSERKSKIKTEVISNKENVSVSFRDGLNSDVKLIKNVLNITNVSKANDLEALVNETQINTSFNSSLLKKKETVILQDENTKTNTSENAVFTELQNMMKNKSDVELKRNRTSDKNMNKTKIINDNNFVTSHLNTNKNALNVTPGETTALKDISFVPQSDTGSRIQSINGNSFNESSENRNKSSAILSSLTASLVHDGNLMDLNESDSDKSNSTDNTKFDNVEMNKTKSEHIKDLKESHENTTQTDVNKTNSTNSTGFAIQTTDSIHQAINSTTGSDTNDTKQNETKSEIDRKATYLNINQIQPVKDIATNITINDGMQSSKKKIGIDRIKENTSIDDNLSETSNETVIIESSEISPSVNESIIWDNGNSTDTDNTDLVLDNKKNETDLIDKDLVEIGSSNKSLNDNKVAFSKQNLKKNKTETDILRSSSKTTENKMSKQQVKTNEVKEVSTIFDPVKNNIENYNMNGNIGPALTSDSIPEFASVNVKSSDVKFSALKAVSRELATKDGDNTIENRNSMKNRLNEKSHFIDVVEGISPKESLTLKGNGALFVTDSNIYGQTGGAHLKQEIIVTSSINEQTESTTPTTTTTVSVISKQLLSNDSILQSKVSSEVTENANKSTISSIENDNKILSQVSSEKQSDHHLINSIVTTDSNVGALKSADTKLVKTETTNGHKLDLPKVIKANIMLPSADIENSAAHLDTVEKTTKTPNSGNGLEFKTVTETNILLSSNTKKGNDTYKGTSKISDIKETPKSSKHFQEAKHGNSLNITTVTETSTGMLLLNTSSDEHSLERTRGNSLDIPTFNETNPDMHSSDKLSSENSQMETRSKGLDLLIVNETSTDMPSLDRFSSEHAQEAERSNGLDLPTVIKTNTAMPSSDFKNMSVAEITSSQIDNATTTVASDLKEVTNITQSSDTGVKMLTNTVSANTAKENDTTVTFQSHYGSSNDIENVTNMTSSGNIVEGKLSVLSLVDSKMKKNKNGLTQTVDENNNSSLVKKDNITSNGNINVQSKKLSDVLTEKKQPPIDNLNTSDITTSNNTSTEPSDLLSTSVLNNTTLPVINGNKNKLLNIQKPNS